MSLKQKTLSGLTWSFIDTIAKQGFVFIIGIVLARLLSPKEFGLIGMTTIFITLSQTFIDSGFGQALVRKQNCTQEDYSTVFFYNLVIGFFMFVILFFLAHPISIFFNEPQLKLIIQVLSTGIIIKSITVIHLVILIKRIDFKTQTIISILASIGSGAFGIYLAYSGYGVWSLVVKTLSNFTLTSVLLWIFNKWSPSLVFSIKSFKELFSFGSKLLVSTLLKKGFENIYLLVIGKFFSATELGFYTRADQFKGLSSNNITVVIQRVSYPALASIQDNMVQLKLAYRRLLKSTILITGFLMVGLAVISQPIILVLIGSKWLPSVELLQLLCIVGFLYPILEINKNMLKVKGRSDIILRVEIFLKILAVPVILVGIHFGIKILILGMITLSLISVIINSHYAGRLIGYRTFEQIKDIYPGILITTFAGSIIFLLNIFLEFQPLISLVSLSTIYVVSFIFVSELFKSADYLYVKKILLEKISSIKNNR